MIYELLKGGFTAIRGAYKGAEINTYQFRRFVERAGDSEDSVLRAARAASLTDSQSAALRSLLDLFMQAAEFMRQFGGKQYWKRMLSHSNDKEAMREFNERLGQLLQLLHIDVAAQAAKWRREDADDRERDQVALQGKMDEVLASAATTAQCTMTRPTY